ncbi:MAG: hypothetical protein JSU87_18205 [Gemmatimonadota bacterium]|nr:MAG: hypothetical protein JSU87_18205 [Gemmatimonadota bacterium]
MGRAGTLFIILAALFGAAFAAWLTRRAPVDSEEARLDYRAAELAEI